MPRQTKLDAKGKRRLPPRDRVQRYLMERLAQPDEPHYKAAIAVGVDPKRASQMAVAWDSNPYLKDTMEMLFRHEVVRPAVRKAAEWLGEVRRRGTKAEKAGKFSAALEASKLEADYMPPEDMPKKEAGLPPQPPLIGQVNLNVILANPESRRALEAVVRILEGQSSGDGGQVVARTVAQS